MYVPKESLGVKVSWITFDTEFGCWVLQLQNALKCLQTEKAGNRTHGRALSPTPSENRLATPFLLRSHLTDSCSLGNSLLVQLSPEVSDYLPMIPYHGYQARTKLGRSYICHLASPPQKLHKGPQVSSIPQEKSCGVDQAELLVQRPEVLSSSCPSPSSLISH